MFTNKNVLIVGGSRGIGSGVVDAFVEAGSCVYYFSRTKGQNEKATHIEVDISNECNILYGFCHLPESLDILINMAAINFCKPHSEINCDEWDSVINTNLRSVFLICKESIKRMKSGSKIVNVSSIAGRNRSIVSGVHYTASKAGVIGLTRQLAYEIGPIGININCVCPSQTMTDMLMESMSDEAREKLSSGIPLRRLATVEDVVKPILFLCSNDSSYIHGACIDINGGQL